MMIDNSPKEKLRREIFKEARYKFESDDAFNKAFEKAYKKLQKIKEELGK